VDEDAEKFHDWQPAKYAAREVNDTFWGSGQKKFGIKISSWPSGRTDRFEYRHRMQSWQLSQLSTGHKFSD